MTTRATGVALAFATAVISGTSIWINGRAVRHFGDATVYTTAKNAVAALLLLVIFLAGSRGAAELRSLSPRRWLALLLLGLVGGSVPFVLFFEGLARAQATQASFIQKTLIVWVALLAVPLLHERFGVPHALAIALLIAGQAWLVGDAGTITFGQGEAMILAATLLWAVEVVYVKWLLRGMSPALMAAARMGFGTALLLAWVAASGRSARAHEPRRRAVALGAPDRPAPHRVCRDVVRRPRPRPGDRRHGRARLRRARHRLPLRHGRRKGGERGRCGPRRCGLRRDRRRSAPQAGGHRDVTAPAAVRALRVPAERARPLRRRRPPHAARVRRRRRVRRRPRRARAHVRGRVALPRADRRRERDRRSPRLARGRGLLGRQRAPRPRRPRQARRSCRRSLREPARPRA